MKSPTSQKQYSQRGFGIVEIILIVAAIGLLVTVSCLVLRNRANQKPAKTNAASTSKVTREKQIFDAADSGDTESPAVIIAPAGDGSESQLANDRENNPTFSFVDTTGWKSYSPKGGAFSVSYREILYGYCADSDNTLFLGLVFLDKNGGSYDCGGIKDAVTWRQFQGRADALFLISRIAFGPAQTLWERGNAKPIAVTLTNGTKANRYDYTNTIPGGYAGDGTQYRTIEYTTTQKGVDYTAVMHWPSNAQDGPATTGASVADFDTIVQRTWAF